MGLAGVKNDVKTLFLIISTLVGLFPGFLLLSYGIADGISARGSGQAPVTIACVVVGLLIVGVTALGYCGAIKENRVMLYIYSGVMALAAVMNLVSLFLIDHVYTSVTAAPILNLGLALLALAAAIVLAGLTRTGVNRLRAQPATE